MIQNTSIQPHYLSDTDRSTFQIPVAEYHRHRHDYPRRNHLPS